MDLHKKPQKNPKKYICEDCDFKCSNKKDYNRHIMTSKHQRTYTDLQPTYSQTYTPEGSKEIKKYVCDCGIEYKHRQSLNKHKQTCVQKNPKKPKKPKNPKKNESLDTPPPPENKVVQEGMNESIVIKCFQTMMEAQSEQTRLLIEAISLNGMQCITNNNNNTTNNNQFNLNVFLNEDCKDAYTLKEVAESIECTVSDLDRMDKDGYAATITRKILESIENMSITERPIHCTDARRNAVCVKSETGWERNEEALKTLNSTIFLIGNKIHGVMDDWRAKYPEHFKGSESRRKQYHRLVLEVIKVSDPVTESHIVKKVCSGVVLDRKAAMAR